MASLERGATAGRPRWRFRGGVPEVEIATEENLGTVE
jgi:hypothetical protein